MAKQRLPVIVGFGGVNAAGRVSGHHAYARMAYSALPAVQRGRTLDALATLTSDVRACFQRLAEQDTSSRVIGSTMALIGRGFKQRH